MMGATVPPHGAPAESPPDWLAELREILADADGGPGALQRGVDLLARSFTSFAALFGAGAGGGPVVLAAAHRDPSRRDSFVARFRGRVEDADAPASLVAGVLRTGSPARGTWSWTAEPHPLAAVPLTVRGATTGVLVLARAGDERPFTADDLHLAERLARDFARAHDHARLRGEVERLRGEVAERSRAADALHASEARLAGIVSLATEAIISIDREQRITLFNHGAERTFGYTADEVMGRRLDLLIPDRFRGMHLSAVGGFAASEVAARRMGERGRIAGLRKDGEEFPAEASISRLTVGGETLLNVVLRDVTERVRAERALADALADAERARSEAESAEWRARFLAAVSAELSASLDYQATLGAVVRLAVPLLADYSITRVRREDGGLQVVGVAHADPAREEMVRDLAARLPAGSGANRTVDRVLETGQAELVEEIGAADRARAAPDPASRKLIEALAPRSFVLAPMRARGRVLGTIALLFAESGRKYTARDLALIQALADRAGLAVDNAGLYAAARDATRARDETLRVVAHDIGNGLSAVRLHATLCARLLPDDEAGAAAREHARHIGELISQVQRLRQDLLDAASLEAGALAMRFAPVDAAELVEEAVARVAPLAAEKEIDLTSDVPEDLPVIAADMERLLQAMGNLLGNAVRFTPSGGSVSVRAERVDGAVRVSVSDTGPGIAPEHLAHVFDRFWRAP
ncbi:MAG TPA: PAS domain S-box protein, partial [Longimicrobium sp.]|nr:PAS domain S-box protein [Longimicrobium sp.]